MRFDRRLQAFHELRGALMDEVAALDPAVLTARPIAGKWSILDIVEHLVLAEREVFRGMPDPSRLVVKKRRLRHRIRHLLVLAVLKAGIRVRVPNPAMVPQGDRDLVELRRLWIENQEWLRACLDHLGPQGHRKAVLGHPVAGPVTVEQAVRIGAVHVERHRRQIRTLLRLQGANR
jgi:uncharacterized damage-inducible protein DinB